MVERKHEKPKVLLEDSSIWKSDEWILEGLRQNTYLSDVFVAQLLLYFYRFISKE